MINQPYTYLIGWTEHQKFYYGVRYAKKSNPKDLMKSYFTSSQSVKQFIKENGLPDLIQIRKTFFNAKAARIWEEKVLRRMNVIKNTKFLNKTNNLSICPLSAGHSKGKTYEEIYGEQRGRIMREKRSASNRARDKVKWSALSRALLSKKNTLGNNPNAQTWNLISCSTQTFYTKKEAVSAAAKELNVSSSLFLSVLQNKQAGKQTSKQQPGKNLHTKFYIDGKNIILL
jgi:hypothetical protein